MSNRYTNIFILVLIGGLAGAYEFYSFYNEDLPKWEKQRSVKETEVAKFSDDLKKYQKFTENIQNIKQEIKELNLQLETVLEQMPRSYNLSQLLRNLTLLAQNSGIEVTSFKPKAAEVSSGGFYNSIQIDCLLKGSFTKMLVFFDQVSRLKRIINVDSLKVKVAHLEARSAGTHTETEMTLKTYRFVE